MQNTLNNITYEKLTTENFNIQSLDDYNRYQETKVNLRLVDGAYVYVDDPYVETWTPTQLTEKARRILEIATQGGIGYVAKNHERVVGFAYLGPDFFGSVLQYVVLEMFHVSNEFRNQGIGKALFRLICDEAKTLPVQKLYISANSAKETQEAYKALGCVFTTEIQPQIADHEPFDIQLEYVLKAMP